MAFTFTDATLLGYQLNKNYLGEGLFSLNTAKDISIEGIFLNLTAFEGVSGSYNKISNYLTGIRDIYDSIVINGYNLGSGKILNISLPDQNPIRLGHYIYNLQVLENSDFTNVKTGDVYGTFLSGVKDKINSFDETLNFENAENGDYSYNHDINIEFYDDKSDLFTKSKDFASSIYNNSLNIGFIGPFSGFYNVLKTKKNYFSETYDLINKRCSFSKRILINKNYNSNYTTTLTHNLTFDANGKINITENGLIKALDNTLAYTAENYFNTELANSYSRCQNIFNIYTEKYGLEQKDLLYNQPFNLGKTANQFENSLEYTVSYVNDPAFEGNIINNYNITVNQDTQGMINYSEQGDLIQVGQIGTITGLNVIKTKYLNAKTRATTNYPSLKLKSSSLNAGNFTINIYNNNFSYSIEKTSDNSIIEDNPYYKSFEMSIEDQEPYDLYKEYIIANRIPKNIFFVSGNQVEIGNKSVTINGTLVKPTGNFWNSPIDFPLADLKSKSISGAFDLISSEAYIDNVNYTYDSDNSFSFNLNVKYLKKVDGA